LKRAIVTGGEGLIGSGIVNVLRQAGWRVCAFDLNSKSHEQSSIACDVADEVSVRSAFERLSWDSLDLLVNCAGRKGAHMGPIEDLALSDWQSFIDSHLTGAFLMTRAAVPLMNENSSIINITSTRAFMSEANTEAYAAAKGGLVALTHALAISLGPQIRCNAIAPGWISDAEGLIPADHEQHPVGRVGQVADIANSVLYLAGADFVTGETIVVDGGMSRKMIYSE